MRYGPLKFGLPSNRLQNLHVLKFGLPSNRLQRYMYSVHNVSEICNFDVTLRRHTSLSHSRTVSPVAEPRVLFSPSPV